MAKKFSEEIECKPPTDEMLEQYSLTAKIDKAIIDYTLDLIEETKKVNSVEKHKITEEITKLYAVIKS